MNLSFTGGSISCIRDSISGTGDCPMCTLICTGETPGSTCSCTEDSKHNKNDTWLIIMNLSFTGGSLSCMRDSISGTGDCPMCISAALERHQGEIAALLKIANIIK